VSQPWPLGRSSLGCNMLYARKMLMKNRGRHAAEHTHFPAINAFGRIEPDSGADHVIWRP
jgi:hypothetical protein